MKKLFTSVLVLLLGVTLLGAANPGTTTSDSNSRVIEIPFSGSTVYTFPGSGSFFTPTSILVVFKDGSKTNTIDINLTRDGVERDLMDYSYTGRTMVWYVPNSLFLKGGDTITITNSDGSAAVATLNLQF